MLSMRVMAYTFHNTTAWWRHVTGRLDFATKTILVSDLPDADIDISPRFHEYMNAPGIAERAVQALGDDGCADIIGRCRLLRILDRDLALRMIGAMWLTIEELLDQERPDLFLCFVVDRYILDLFQRALVKRDVRYVGLAIGVLPDTFMFMARGEYIPVREPTDAEIDDAVAALAQPEFVPDYARAQRFGIARFLALYLRFTARWAVFEAARLIRRRPYDYRYLTARSPASGFRVRLRDWGITRYFRDDWRQRLDETPFERRVFIALSVNPEAAIEYWLHDRAMVDYASVLERLARVLGAAGFGLFVKDHPNQFGFRQVELYSALARFPAVTFVPYDVPGQWLIDRCRATFTWTGTVGLQAAMAGRSAIIDASAYYFVRELFIALSRPEDIDDLPARLEKFIPPLLVEGARRALARHFLRSSVPGSYLSWRRFSADDPEAVEHAETLVVSLNRYLPAILAIRAA